MVSIDDAIETIDEKLEQATREHGPDHEIMQAVVDIQRVVYEARRIAHARDRLRTAPANVTTPRHLQTIEEDTEVVKELAVDVAQRLDELEAKYSSDE